MILASKRESAPSGADRKIWKDDNPPVSLAIAPFAYGRFKDMLISGGQICHANRFISSQPD